MEVSLWVCLWDVEDNETPKTFESRVIVYSTTEETQECIEDIAEWAADTAFQITPTSIKNALGISILSNAVRESMLLCVESRYTNYATIFWTPDPLTQVYVTACTIPPSEWTRALNDEDGDTIFMRFYRS